MHVVRTACQWSGSHVGVARSPSTCGLAKGSSRARRGRVAGSPRVRRGLADRVEMPSTLSTCARTLCRRTSPMVLGASFGCSPWFWEGHSDAAYGAGTVDLVANGWVLMHVVRIACQWSGSHVGVAGSPRARRGLAGGARRGRRGFVKGSPIAWKRLPLLAHALGHCVDGHRPWC